MSRRILLGMGATGIVVGVSAWALSAKNSPPANAGQRTAGDQGPPGTLAWTFQTGFRVNANPAVVNGTVYFGSGDSQLYAVSASTGRKVWSLPAGPATAAPTVGSGIVCVSATQGNFYAVHAASGKPAWHLNGNQLDNYQRNWAIDGRYVALARGDMTVQMNDVASGVQRWTATTLDEGGYTQTIAASHGVVYAVSRPGGLHALTAATGREIYRVQLLRNGASPSTNLIISGDTMYLGSDTGPLYAIHPGTGKVRWTYQPRNRFPQSDPVVADGIVYFNDNLSTLHAVDASSGRPVWTYDDNGGDAVSPAVAGGYVYVPARSGLQQLDAETGEPGWTFNPSTGGQFFSTPVVADGLIFLGCDDHRVYAIRAM
jgi:outer membrane protein assembly factor BamB